ncbi:MAG: hypothetical protein HZC38_06545 [Chloroflexi bacterium]|nr:hypothetical protein [Chloroflexota bacterium]
MVQIGVSAKIFGVSGFIVCLITCLVIFQSLLSDPHQEIFPLPAFYLFEMIAASLVAAMGTFKEGEAWNKATWAAGGIIAAFVLIGAWSIGFFFIPTAILVLITALLSWRRHHTQFLIAVITFTVAFVAQIILMFAAIRVLYPNVMF